MGPPIHYYGDMTMEDNKDKTKTELTDMLDSIIDEVLNSLDIPEDDEDKEDKK